MNQYILAGLIGGIFAYLGKWIIFMIGTMPPKTRWIRTLFHLNGFTMFLLDCLSGYIITHMIASAGATGLTTLFILISFSACSVLYICLHMACNKSINLIKELI